MDQPGDSSNPSLPANSDQSNKVRIFISYAHDDAPIAKALYEALLEVDRERIECFMDIEAIESGRSFEPEIISFLASADWLICIYTGEQSEYCGWEVGVFRQTRSQLGPKDSRLVCLFHTSEYPGIFRNHQNHKVIFPPKTKPQDDFNEEHFYLHCPLARFFSNIYSYNGLYTTRNQSEAQRQTKTLVKHAKAITEAFVTVTSDEKKSDTPTQLLIEVTIPSQKTSPLEAMPDNSTITGTFASFRLFGLMPPMENRQLPIASWGRLKEVVTRPGAGPPLWLLYLEKDMLNAANGLTLTGTSVSFPSNGAVYRPILARHVIFQGGENKFEVLFVETLPRQFLGNKLTSVLLSSIVLASRLRFAYFEHAQETYTSFENRVPLRDFEARCRQLIYDIERLEHESLEFGVDEINFLAAFGPEHKALAETFISTWKEGTHELFRVLPQKFSFLNETDRVAIRTAIIKFLSDVETENRRFLVTAIDLYREEIRKQLETSKSLADLARI